MARSTVLILTREEDAHAPPVIQELRRRGIQSVCLDLADLPTRLAHAPLVAMLSTDACGWEGTCHCPPGEAWGIEEVISVWWRRPRFPQAAGAYAPPVQTFIQDETTRGFLGVLAERPVVWEAAGQNREAEPAAHRLRWGSARAGSISASGSRPRSISRRSCRPQRSWDGAFLARC